MKKITSLSKIIICLVISIFLIHSNINISSMLTSNVPDKSITTLSDEETPSPEMIHKK